MLKHPKAKPTSRTQQLSLLANVGDGSMDLLLHPSTLSCILGGSMAQGMGLSVSFSFTSS